jgi:hypothetical protein
MNALRKFSERFPNLASITGLCLVVIFPAGVARAADPSVTAKERSAICAREVCRTEKTITLRAPKDNLVRFKTDPVPYVDDGIVTIYPGESYAVRLRVGGENLEKPVFERGSEGKPLPAPAGHRAADETKALRDSAAKPVEGLIYFSFKQQEGVSMLLEIVSTLPVTVKYDAVTFVATPNGILPDPESSCPVFSGAAGSENFPVPVTMLALSNFRVVTEGNLACK